jgi:hypothetical protein
MTLLLDKSIRKILTAAGGTLQQQRQRDSGLTPQEFVVLVAVLAHELTHLRDALELKDEERERPQIAALRRRGPGERNTMYEERRVLAIFRDNRGRLIEQWRSDDA